MNEKICWIYINVHFLSCSHPPVLIHYQSYFSVSIHNWRMTWKIWHSSSIILDFRQPLSTGQVLTPYRRHCSTIHSYLGLHFSRDYYRIVVTFSALLLRNASLQNHFVTHHLLLLSIPYNQLGAIKIVSTRFTDPFRYLDSSSDSNVGYLCSDLGTMVCKISKVFLQMLGFKNRVFQLACLYWIIWKRSSMDYPYQFLKVSKIFYVGVIQSKIKWTKVGRPATVKLIYALQNRLYTLLRLPHSRRFHSLLGLFHSVSVQIVFLWIILKYSEKVWFGAAKN